MILAVCQRSALMWLPCGLIAAIKIGSFKKALEWQILKDEHLLLPNCLSSYCMKH